MDAGIDELRLLADPTRARILQLVLSSDQSRSTVTALAGALGLTQPTLSHHVRVLHDAGLLARLPEGRRVWYSVPDGHVDLVAALLPTSDSAGATDTLDRIIDDLGARFSGTFNRDTVERYVVETDALLQAQGVSRQRSSKVAGFAADRLTALAHEGMVDDARPEVLFVCVQNAGRSQLAAAILRHLAGDRIRVRTAGSAPADAVRGVVVTALDEIGVPLGGEFPKPLTDEVVRAADVVVTMGCGDACPVYPSKVYLDWPIDDPAGLPLPAVRVIRDDIDARVRGLLATLT
ncbi:metalloregulator ArsR/SmtB family transcription factor [Microbacterium sp. NPDC076911]|uniref:metalloregulator ArsR/SmtB family transcription factor n=1 Tax=Microbacterium sp. NPDC076911 TaxID=3154958 RepID=UPI0034375D5A